MSKAAKKPARKDNKKEIVPEVKEPEIPLEIPAEEVEDPAIKARADELLANIERVKFAVPRAKQIVSGHSGSILANPDPVTPLDLLLKDNACVAFREVAADQITIAESLIYDVLVKCGFLYDKDILNGVIKRIYSGPADLDESTFLDFLQKFHAPEYYYGQRLRRNVGRGQIDEVVQLLVRNCDVNTGDGEGLTSLHYACEFNKPDVIRAMLKTVPEGRLKIDCQDKYGWTPLYCAAHHGNLDCVVLLIELGARPLVRNSVGKTALHAACAQNRGSIADYLLKSVMPAITSTRGSISAAPSEDVAALLNAQDDKGMTPLHEAAYRGHGSLYQILSRNANADLTVRDQLNYTAADYLGDFSVVQSVSAGARPVTGDATRGASAHQQKNQNAHK